MVSPSPQHLSRGNVALSTTRTSEPAFARVIAAAAPAGPAPTTRTPTREGRCRGAVTGRGYPGSIRYSSAIKRPSGRVGTPSRCAVRPINRPQPTADVEGVTSPVVASNERADAPSFDSIRGARTSTAPASFTPVRQATLTLIIPMYREESRIEATVAALADSVLHRDDIEFLFVDDGSPDGTCLATQQAIDRIGLRSARILRLIVNTGKGGALKAGVLEAGGANIGFVDADLSLDPAEISQALARLLATNADLVVGHRIVDAAQQPKLRRLASLVFRSVARRLVPTSATDTQCALKLFRAPVAKDLFEALSTTGFAFDVELLRRADQAGLRIEDVPVAWQHQPGSRVNTVTDSVRMLREILAIRRSIG